MLLHYYFLTLWSLTRVEMDVFFCWWERGVHCFVLSFYAIHSDKRFFFQIVKLWFPMWAFLAQHILMPRAKRVNKYHNGFWPFLTLSLCIAYMMGLFVQRRDKFSFGSRLWTCSHTYIYKQLPKFLDNHKMTSIMNRTHSYVGNPHPQVKLLQEVI